MNLLEILCFNQCSCRTLYKVLEDKSGTSQNLIKMQFLHLQALALTNPADAVSNKDKNGVHAHLFRSKQMNMDPYRASFRISNRGYRA